MLVGPSGHRRNGLRGREAFLPSKGGVRRPHPDSCWSGSGVAWRDGHPSRSSALVSSFSLGPHFRPSGQVIPDTIPPPPDSIQEVTTPEDTLGLQEALAIPSTPEDTLPAVQAPQTDAAPSGRLEHRCVGVGSGGDSGEQGPDPRGVDLERFPASCPFVGETSETPPRRRFSVPAVAESGFSGMESKCSPWRGALWTSAGWA